MRTLVYRPDKAWKKNVMVDCLYDSRGRRWEEKPKRIEVERREMIKKDYQVEVPYGQ